MKKAVQGWFSVLALTLVLASCGGGGGGGNGGEAPPAGGSGTSGPSETIPGSNGGSASNPDGSWLTFTPNQLEVAALPGADQYLGIVATSAKTIPGVINVAIIDDKGVILPQRTSVRAITPMQYEVSMMIHPTLVPGTHTGSFEVRLCYDAPATCARPLEGSPWFVSYRIKMATAASLSFTGWRTVSTNAGFLENFALSSIGDTPLVVSAGQYSKVMETWSSRDSGGNWVNMYNAEALPLTKGFALAQDGSSVYLSGGEALPTQTAVAPANPTTSHVWKFNGARWQQQTAAAAFPRRSEHVMAKVGGTLYAMGGRNGATVLTDLWRSADEGVTWSKVADSLPGALGQPTCALNWNGSLLVIGKAVATSGDGGLSWKVHAAVPGSTRPLVQCASFKGRLVVANVNDIGNAASSDDLENWQLEPKVLFPTIPAPGMAAINGRLVITGGSGSSQRVTYRTYREALGIEIE